MSDSETQIWDEAENNLSEAPLAENENLDDAMDNLFPNDDAPHLEESIAQMQAQDQAEAPANEASLDSELDNVFPEDEAEDGESTPEESVATDEAEVSEESWDEASTDEDSAEVSEGEVSTDASVAEESWDEAPADDPVAEESWDEASADESMPEESEGEASPEDSLVEASSTEVSAETIEDPTEETAGIEVENFNLAALTALVDDIRSESERVSEMKDTVAKALSLIQEMTDSLKS